MSTILILGAMSDVAQALAHEYAANGYDVLLAARNKDRLEPLQKDLQLRHGVKAHIFEFDALDYSSHAGFYRDLSVNPEIVACVFGYLGSTQKGLLDWKEASQILNINYTGAVSILNVVASNMMERKHGTIIGISSVA